MVWEITLTTLGELPLVLLFKLGMWAYCVMGASTVNDRDKHVIETIFLPISFNIFVLGAH